MCVELFLLFSYCPFSVYSGISSFISNLGNSCLFFSHSHCQKFANLLMFSKKTDLCFIVLFSIAFLLFLILSISTLGLLFPLNLFYLFLFWLLEVGAQVIDLRLFLLPNVFIFSAINFPLNTALVVSHICLFFSVNFLYCSIFSSLLLSSVSSILPISSSAELFILVFLFIDFFYF